MELTQEIMDIYVTGATDCGMKNWTDRYDINGIKAVLEYIDPVPSDVKIVTDGEGTTWYRNRADPMIWYNNNEKHRTARKITEEFGEISWKVEA
jgi:hypothetical protein